jgi:hypothetical protein
VDYDPSFIPIKLRLERGLMDHRAPETTRVEGGFAERFHHGQGSQVYPPTRGFESFFVLHRITSQNKYQEAAWNMFDTIANGTATDIANAAVMDVTTETRPLPQEDYREASLPRVAYVAAG